MSQHPEISPELDLLERLSALDADLRECAFGSIYAFRDLNRAKHVVTLYLKMGLVELFDSASESKQTIPFHTGRHIVQMDSNWEKGTTYFLRITKKGYQRFAGDSVAFFDKLFSESEESQREKG